MTKSAKGAPKRRSADRTGGARARPLSAETIRAVEAAMASLAHEIRTPLSGILAISELLATSELGERERAWIAVLRGSAEHINAFASLIIDGARAEEDRLVLRRQSFDLRRVAQTVATSLGARAEVKGLRCTWKIADDLPEAVSGDPVRLRASLENLIDNAVKFTEAGEVRLDVAYKDGHASFTVTDSGIGLTTDEISRLFRPFSQASDSVGERFGGAGLGLAFVRRVAQAMGGDVTVTSEPGRGSTFCLTVALEPSVARHRREELPERPLLPAAPVAPAQPQPTTVKPPEERPAEDKPTDEKPKQNQRMLRILCAEDNVYGRIITKTILTELGHKVEFVGSGSAVVEAVSRNRYDAVLMDVVLSGVDGIEATRRIRMLPGPASQVPVIGLSGHGARENEAAARASGMDGYLHKPVSARALADTLAELARR